jgi:hypothetical protein
MKWFKHDSDAAIDAKIEKLIVRYGLEGYGLYFYCLELIAKNIDKDNLTFELEHDAELISRRVGLHPDRVQEMMGYMVDLSLFENDRGVITCFKLAYRLDDTTSRNPEIKKMQAGLNAIPELTPKRLRSKSEETSDRLEEIRLEENKNTSPSGDEKKLRADHLFDEFWAAYPTKTGKKKCLEIWKRRRLGDGLADTILEDIKTRKEKDRKWIDGFIPNPSTYLNGDRWEDEISEPRVTQQDRGAYSRAPAPDRKDLI